MTSTRDLHQSAGGTKTASRNKQEETREPRNGANSRQLGGDNGPHVSLIQAAKEVEINGVRLQYVEQGSGEAMVFVHGAPSDLRDWEPVREGIASRYRFLAYTQRYFGTAPWPDDGKNFSIQTLADDLTKFITSLNAGPVHLVSWSYGGLIAMSTALENPKLVRSLILYEPSVISVLPAESAEGKVAREDRFKSGCSSHRRE